MIYSPVAIIRNAQIWNINLLLAFFKKINLNPGFKISCSVRRNFFLTINYHCPDPRPLAWVFRHFRLTEKRGGGGLKRRNSGVTAYISVFKFLQVSVKSIVILIFKHCHLVCSLDSISVNRIHFTQYEYRLI